MNKYKLFTIGLVILLVLTACGTNNSKTQELSNEISALETQIAGLERILTTALVTSTTAPQKPLSTDLSPTDITPTEISPTEIPPTEIPPTEITSTEIPYTQPATPKPTSTITPPSEAFTCGKVIASTPLYQESYTKSGKLRKNDAGHLILEAVPTYQVQRYSVGERICYYKYAIQVDGVRVFLISSTRGLGYYIPINAVAGDN